MNEKSKKSKRVGSVVLAVIAVALLIGCAILFISQQKQKAELTELRIANEQLAFELDSVSQKAVADELFINQEFDEAWEAYAKIPNTDGDVLIERREAELKARRMLRSELMKEAEFLEASAEEREKMRQIQLSAAEINFQNRLDSVKTEMNERIGKLRNQLMQKEAKLAEAPELGRLEFYNSKGTKINYFGEVENGKAHGEGVGIYGTGSVYDGEWKNNKKHGGGTYQWKDGERYEGQFAEDKRDGKGTYYWTNGDRYVGSWDNDRRNGIGVLYNSENEVVLEGDWKNDEFVKSIN